MKEKKETRERKRGIVNLTANRMQIDQLISQLAVRQKRDFRRERYRARFLLMKISVGKLHPLLSLFFPAIIVARLQGDPNDRSKNSRIYAHFLLLPDQRRINY